MSAESVALDTVSNVWDGPRMTEQTYSFGPADAFAITGVSQTQQRDWRRHGYIKNEKPGWAEYDLSGLAELFLIKAYSTVSGSVADGRVVAEALSPTLASYTERTLNGEPASAPDDTAVVDNGRVRFFPSPQAAVTGMEPPTGAITLFVLSLVATPFAIRVRDHLKARA